MENKDFSSTRPISPVAGYIGGKRQLAKTLVPMINATPHTIYAEAFVGMGGVFFKRDQKPKVEVINDLSADVATLFRVLQRHHQALLDMLKWQLASRADFDRLTQTDPDTLTDLERAARFLFLQRMAFGGKVAGRTMGVSTTSRAKFNLASLVPLLEEAHARLDGVYIERLPYGAFIDRWDRPETLFFLDPPYHGVEHYYGRALFSREDYDDLSRRLQAIKGHFIMTLNDVPEVRRIFGWASIEPVRLTYTCAGKPTEGKEVIIRRP